jgi:hypothetical protein
LNSSLWLSGCVGEKRRDRHAESAGDPHNVKQAEVSFAALDPPEIGAVQSGSISQFLLRDAKTLSLCANTGTEPLEILLKHVGIFPK